MLRGAVFSWTQCSITLLNTAPSTEVAKTAKFSKNIFVAFNAPVIFRFHLFCKAKKLNNPMKVNRSKIGKSTTSSPFSTAVRWSCKFFQYCKKNSKVDAILNVIPCTAINFVILHLSRLWCFFSILNVANFVLFCCNILTGQKQNHQQNEHPSLGSALST